ncbi:MAG: RIO2 family protein [Planctomycetota bacterium]|jgi:predicted Ser/Thr protein kinase
MSGNVLRDKGGLLSPVIRMGEHRGRPAVIKDFRGKNFLTRSVIGPSLIRREFDVLRRLEGVPGVPRAYAMLDGAALVTEYVEGRTMSKYHAGDLPASVFDDLGRIMRSMHERDVVHLDLRQKKNILITPELKPYLIDYGGAIAPGPGSALRRLLPWLRRVDESALLKMKQRTFPDLLTDGDRAALRRHRFWRKFWIFTPRSKYVR